MEKELAVKVQQFEAYTLTTDEILELFAELIRTGKAWKMIGIYPIIANGMIEDGWITKEGEITAFAWETD